MYKFSEQELHQYHRQLILPEFGPEGQTKLKNTSVLIIGAGGLGCPTLQYLAAAGVGSIGIVDHDKVGISNLHRQILYTHQDVGQLKVEVAAKKLATLNPLIDLKTYPIKLNAENAIDLFANYDIIVDGSDNFPTRYLVNDASVISAKPLIYGAIYKFEGQVSVFNAVRTDGSRSANYRDLFPSPPTSGSVPSCSEVGVLGVLPGMIGCFMANEVIKLIIGLGEPLIEKLLTIDTLSLATYTLKFKKQESTKIRSLIDYEQFCNVSSSFKAITISVNELKVLLDEEQNHTVIDVRQEIEYAQGNITPINIPLQELATRIKDYTLEGKYILYCKSGRRSEKAAQVMHELGYQHVRHLEGGLIGYQEEVGIDIKIM